MLLAAITFSNIRGGVNPHGLPVIDLGVGSMCQCSAAGMIPAYPIVEFGQYTLSLLLSEAFQIGSAQGSFILLFVNEREPSCLGCDLAGFCSVIR